MYRKNKPKVLFVSLEFPTWDMASHYSYWLNLGFEDGFEANGIDYFTLTVGHQYAEKKITWLKYAKELCGSQQFDQVWAEIVHSDLDESFLEWLTTIAPIRIGLSGETLELTKKERLINPQSSQIRDESLQKRLRYFTHLVTLDEKDVDRITQEGIIPVMWLPAGIMPQRLIYSGRFIPNHNAALFYGSLYEERKQWIEHKALGGLIVRPSKTLEDFTSYPKAFDMLQTRAQTNLNNGNIEIDVLNDYMATLRHIRRECFSAWLQTLRIGSAVVNLPQLSNVYAGRVIEGMAAGRPVISWEIPDHPRVKSLFEDGNEILLYSKDEPECLAEHIRHVRADPLFAGKIVNNARKKIEGFHTTERYVKNIFEWASGQVLDSSGALRASKFTYNENNIIHFERLRKTSNFAKLLGRISLRVEISLLATISRLRANPRLPVWFFSSLRRWIKRFSKLIR